MRLFLYTSSLIPGLGIDWFMGLAICKAGALLSRAWLRCSWLWFHPPSSDIWAEAAERAAELMRLDASQGTRSKVEGLRFGILLG